MLCCPPVIPLYGNPSVSAVLPWTTVWLSPIYTHSDTHMHTDSWNGVACWQRSEEHSQVVLAGKTVPEGSPLLQQPFLAVLHSVHWGHHHLYIFVARYVCNVSISLPNVGPPQRTVVLMVLGLHLWGRMNTKTVTMYKSAKFSGCLWHCGFCVRRTGRGLEGELFFEDVSLSLAHPDSIL